MSNISILPASTILDFAKSGQRLSAYAGPATRALAQHLEGLSAGPSVAVSTFWNDPQTKERTVDRSALHHVLFEIRGRLKIATSRVSMHLSRSWRNVIFSHIDRLFAEASWDEGDTLPSAESFATFLRTVIHERTLRAPSLGVSNSGNFLAAWLKGQERLTVEFLPGDRIRWALVHFPDGDRESIAGEGSIVRFRVVLGPFSFGWIFDASPTD